MKSAVTESQGLKRRLKLEISVEEVQKSFFRQYERIQKKARIPGFRQGKAPQNVLKQNYGDTARREVLDDLFQTFYPRALKEHHIHPAASPALTDIKLEEDQPCTLTLQLEVHPEIKPLNTLKFKIKKQDTNVTEDEVEDRLRNLQRAVAKFKEYPEGRAVQRGDWLRADMTCFSNGQKVEEFTFSEQIFPVEERDTGFNRNFTGLKVQEEKEFKWTFEKTHHLSSVAGKTCDLKVTVKKILQRILPEPSDELAKKYGHETLLDLKESIRKQLLYDKEHNARDSMEDEIREKLIQENPLPLPESMVRERTEMLLEEKRKELKERAVSPQRTEQALREQKEEFEKAARKILHYSYLMNRVISDLKIHLTADDITRRLKEAAPLKDPEKVKASLKSAGRWDSFVSQSKFIKAVDRLIENAELV